jgi:hypothetical protein
MVDVDDNKPERPSASKVVTREFDECGVGVASEGAPKVEAAMSAMAASKSSNENVDADAMVKVITKRNRGPNEPREETKPVLRKVRKRNRVGPMQSGGRAFGGVVYQCRSA